MLATEETLATVRTRMNADAHGSGSAGEDSTPDDQQGDEELLQEIRDRYSYYFDAWQYARHERNVDMRYVCGDPWDPKDRRAREDPGVGRPCISQDELSQYVNQTVNSIRQNKRGIKVDPKGGASNAKTAELRQDLVRTIEYQCNGPSIYCSAFQQMVEGSYSFFRITRRYISDDPDIADQEICIKPIANPDSVLFDPDCKEPDWSDALACFVIEPVKRKEFKRKYPWAQITDFSADHMLLAKDWIRQDDILVGEYWRIQTEMRKGRKRTAEVKTVWQYLTNGVEILKRTKVPGKHLPIIPMIGMERYRDGDQGQAKRELFSLVRLARDPQMALAYLVSGEAEEAGLLIKSPYIGYKGQFESARVAWENSTKIPTAFLEADAWTEQTGPTQLLPLPQRQDRSPNFQAWEVAIDSKRRAIQAAMGIAPLPTAAQRANQKSGVAIDKVQEEQAIGSYHFIDGYDRALGLAGRVIDAWIPDTYDAEDREIALRKANEKHINVRLNTKEPYLDDKGQQVHYMVGDEDHYVTISDGPSYMSEQDRASQFVDLLVQNLQALPLAPPQAQKILAISIQLKALGPLGDEMAEIIAPSDNGQQLQQAQMMQTQLMQAKQLIQALQTELQKAGLEKQGKVIEGQFKLQQSQLQEDAETLRTRLEIDSKLAVAEISTKAQILSERVAALEKVMMDERAMQHEANQNALDRQHEKDQATRQQLAAQAQQTQAEQAAAEQQQAQPQQAQQ